MNSVALTAIVITVIIKNCNSTRDILLSPRILPTDSSQSSVYKTSYSWKCYDGHIHTSSHTNNRGSNILVLFFSKLVCPVKITIINGHANSLISRIDRCQLSTSNNSMPGEDTRDYKLDS